MIWLKLQGTETLPPQYSGVKALCVKWRDKNAGETYVSDIFKGGIKKLNALLRWYISQKAMKKPELIFLTWQEAIQNEHVGSYLPVKK